MCAWVWTHLEWCLLHGSARIHSPISRAAFSLCCPPPSHCLYDPSPPHLHSPSFPPSSASLRICPRLRVDLTSGKTLSFAASCVSSNDRLGSGFRTFWSLFYAAASKSHPLILNHSTASLERMGSFSLPGEAKSLAALFLGMRCCRSVDPCGSFVNFNPFKVGITEQGWASCMIHTQEVMETPRYS